MATWMQARETVVLTHGRGRMDVEAPRAQASMVQGGCRAKGARHGQENRIGCKRGRDACLHARMHIKAMSLKSNK